LPLGVLEVSTSSMPWSALATFAERLYRVIRSGVNGLGVAGLLSAVDIDVEDADTGRGGWNVCGGLMKVSLAIRNKMHA